MFDVESLALPDYPIYSVELEYRQRGRRITGSFPYGQTATLSDRGRVRKERFGPRAFEFAVNDPARDIHLLVGHSFDAPLASKLGRSLRLSDSDSALEFAATLPAENRQPTWMRDAVLAISGGLMTGISPGFRVPPPAVLPDAEENIPEPGNPDILIRHISMAVLFELSGVTRAAYLKTTLDLRQRDGVTVDPADPAGAPVEELLRWLL